MNLTENLNQFEKAMIFWSCQNVLYDLYHHFIQLISSYEVGDIQFSKEKITK